jgi:hypothetical protein
MQTGNPRPTGMSVTPDDNGDLLECRMEMLGLDRYALETTDRQTLEEIIRRCARCGVRDACTVDLKRDPNNPVWETYCPNAAALIGLTEARWRKK